MRREKQLCRPSLGATGLLVVCLLLESLSFVQAETQLPRPWSEDVSLHRPADPIRVAQRSAPSSDISVRDDLLSVNIQEQELQSVIESIASQGDIEVENFSELPPTRISLRFDNLPLVDGLKRILHAAAVSGYAMITAEQDGNTRVQRLIFLGAAPGAPSSQVAARPQRSEPSRTARPTNEATSEQSEGGPTSVFDDIKRDATMRRLLSQLLHTNEQVRERALERLVRMVEDDIKQAELLDALEPLLEDLAAEDSGIQEDARTEIRDLLRR